MDDNTRQVLTTLATASAALLGVAFGSLATWWLERGRRIREDRFRFIDSRRNAYDEWIQASLEQGRIAHMAAHHPDAPSETRFLEVARRGEAAFSGLLLHGSQEAIVASSDMLGAGLALSDLAAEVAAGRLDMAAFEQGEERSREALSPFQAIARRDLGIGLLDG